MATRFTLQRCMNCRSTPAPSSKNRVELMRRRAFLSAVAAAGGCKGFFRVAEQKRAMAAKEGMALRVQFMTSVKAMLEDKGVTLCMENATSRYPDNVLGRPDQLCDRPSWGFEMCKRVNSPNVKMLFDIYHAQIMEGNVAATIKDNFQWIFHFHTAGAPRS